MANYYGFTRTNYFRIKNEEAFKEYINTLATTDGDFELWTKEDNNETYYAFGGNGSLYSIENDEEDIYQKLSEYVHQHDAIIITEVGYEKLRYLTGVSMVITQKGYEVVDLYDASLNKAKQLLSDETYKTNFAY